MLRRVARRSARPKRPELGTSSERWEPQSGPVEFPYPGDYEGRTETAYAPWRDSKTDPGEVVWAWVPYEEDHSKGKDRPVLIVGRDGFYLLGLQLSSQDHDLDAADEARFGRTWMDVGTGPWDRQGRPSEVRLDRVIRVHPTSVRRIGSVMERSIFDQVTAAMREARGW